LVPTALYVYFRSGGASHNGYGVNHKYIVSKSTLQSSNEEEEENKDNDLYPHHHSQNSINNWTFGEQKQQQRVN